MIKNILINLLHAIRAVRLARHVEAQTYGYRIRNINGVCHAYDYLTREWRPVKFNGNGG